MHWIGWVVAVIVGIAWFIAPSMAQSSGLVGTWTAEATIILESDGKIVKVPRSLSVVIDSVQGSVVQGSNVWKAKTDNPGYVEDESVLQASEPLIGVLSADDKTL